MNTSPTILVRAADAEDRGSIERLLNQSWGSTTVVTRGSTHDASQLPAPSIPLVGQHGIPIRDVLEFELELR